MNHSYRAFFFLCGLMVALHGCGSSGDSPTPPGGAGGTGAGFGLGGTGGMAGAAGVGGDGGGGTSGEGGMSGSGGSGGTGNGAGTGGSGGTGNSIGGGPGFAPVGSACNTNVLCSQCPTSLECDSDDDCAIAGTFCGSTGCTSDDGLMIGRCQEPTTPTCSSVNDCPNPSDYECGTVGFGTQRCLRTSPGCNPGTESFDCPVGYACEGGGCVDRRVPCADSFDCPQSFTCEQFANAKFCVRIYRDCNVDEDCGLLAPRCADVDNDGRKECAGEIDDDVCVNSDCPGSAPVCENGNFGTGNVAVCGDYGLCRNDGECGNGFNCAALGADGRRECVQNGNGDCESNRDCPLNEVCAADRDGGVPQCQAGAAN